MKTDILERLKQTTKINGAYPKDIEDAIEEIGLLEMKNKNLKEMSVLKTGGPAFPVSVEVAGAMEMVGDISGMTLRDYFAAKAMQALHIDNTNIHGSAKFAYKVADAMLEERKV